jgi:maleylacetoacetate isomerase
MIVLHDYYRSSAAYRVRIALALKRLRYDRHAVDLVKGAQRSPQHIARNPQGLVPMLEIDGFRLTQSLAIIEYLDERFPEPQLLPPDPAGRARVRAFAQAIACDIHPLNNLRVLNYLEQNLDIGTPARKLWYARWISDGFAALEAIIADGPGPYCFGEQPGMADILLVPQMYNARRFSVDVAPYPTLCARSNAAELHPAFAAAHPDAVEG